MSDTSFSGYSDRDERRGAAQYLHAIRSHWRLIALITAVATVSALIFTSTTPKQYDATADIILSPLSGNDETFQGFSLFRQSFDGSSSVVTASRVFNSAQTSGPVDAALRRKGIVATVVAEPLSQADIVSIRANAGSAADAAMAANIFADTAVATRGALFQKELNDRIARLRRRANAVPVAQRDTNVEYAAIAQRLGELRGFVGSADPTLRIAARATPPLAASWPRPRLTVAAAIFASLLLGIGLAVLLEFANPRISREDSLLLEQRLPILARIPKLSTRAVHSYLAGTRQLPSSAWKGYRTLRASLATAGPDGSFPRSILITSASPSDGKTMTAVNLAITLAAADMRVVLVDADLHRPMVATIFKTGAPPGGFAGMLANRAPLESLIIHAPAHPRLRLLLSRRETIAPVRLFDGPRVRRIVNELQHEADVVVFDSPPLTEVAEALELAAAVDAVILSVRLGHTRRDRLAELRDMLSRRGVSPVGFVVTTRVRSDTESPYGYQDDVTPTLQDRTSDRKVVRLSDR